LIRVFTLAFCLRLLASGELLAQGRIEAIYQFPELSIKQFQNGMLPGSVVNDRKISLGSVGSDLWRGPTDGAGEFWMVTDRGPNGQVRVDGKRRRTFWIPEFNPAIVRVKTEGDSIKILQTVPIVGASGKSVTGMPNLKGIDETPYDYTAQKEFAFNVNGLDTEGLVRTKNGEFWLTDEYSPSLLRVAANGKVVKRFVPAGLQLPGADYAVEASLPAVLAKRKINRGFEGLALSSDEKTLYLILQSPLGIPDQKSGEESRNTRVFVFDRETERVTKEYVYRFDEATEFDPRPKMNRDEMKLSAVAYLNPTTLLILERTDWVAKLYSVDLSRATNILNSKWDDPKTVPSLESSDDLAKLDIRPLPKSLVLDLGRFKDMPEKMEGIAVIDAKTIAITNDNDFDSDESKYDDEGNNVGKGKRSQIFVISLDKPLPLNSTSELLTATEPSIPTEPCRC
jgi:hypothetical protein